MILSSTNTVRTPEVETWCILLRTMSAHGQEKTTIINFFLSGNDYRINIGHLTGGSLASSYGGDISIGEVDEGSHARDVGYVPPPPPPPPPASKWKASAPKWKSSSANSGEGNVNVGLAEEGSHVRDFGYAKPPPSPPVPKWKVPAPKWKSSSAYSEGGNVNVGLAVGSGSWTGMDKGRVNHRARKSYGGGGGNINVGLAG